MQTGGRLYPGPFSPSFWRCFLILLHCPGDGGLSITRFFVVLRSSFRAVRYINLTLCGFLVQNRVIALFRNWQLSSERVAGYIAPLMVGVRYKWFPTLQAQCVVVKNPSAWVSNACDCRMYFHIFKWKELNGFIAYLGYFMVFASSALWFSGKRPFLFLAATAYVCIAFYGVFLDRLRSAS